MRIFTISHFPTYHYKRSVAFGEHLMMLRPCGDDNQGVLESELAIASELTEPIWTQDDLDAG